MDYVLLPGRIIPPKTRALTGGIDVSNGSRVWFESSIERDALMILDFEHPDANITTQPFTIEYSKHGRKRRYTPDILLSGTNGEPGKTILFEVKPKKELQINAAKYEAAFRIANRVCADRGWGFEILTEDDAPPDYVTNIGFLRAFKTAVGEVEFMNVLLQELRTHPQVSPNQLLETCFQSKQNRLAALPALWHLMANRVIETNLAEPINMNTSALRIVE